LVPIKSVIGANEFLFSCFKKDLAIGRVSALWMNTSENRRFEHSPRRGSRDR
jgi:hypothetical protein